MALGYLVLAFIISGVLAIIGTILLLIIKKKRPVDILMVLMTAFSILTAYLNATSQPSNFIAEQITAWLIGLIAVGGLGLRFVKKEQILLSKLLVIGSTIVGVVYLYFF